MFTKVRIECRKRYFSRPAPLFSRSATLACLHFTKLISLLLKKKLHEENILVARDYCKYRTDIQHNVLSARSDYAGWYYAG